MDDYDHKPDSGGPLTARALLAVGLVLLGVSHLCGGVAILLSPVLGPFASSAVGIGLVVIGVRVYRGERLLM